MNDPAQTIAEKWESYRQKCLPPRFGAADELITAIAQAAFYSGYLLSDGYARDALENMEAEAAGKRLEALRLEALEFFQSRLEAALARQAQGETTH